MRPAGKPGIERNPDRSCSRDARERNGGPVQVTRARLFDELYPFPYARRQRDRLNTPRLDILRR